MFPFLWYSLNFDPSGFLHLLVVNFDLSSIFDPFPLNSNDAIYGSPLTRFSWDTSWIYLTAKFVSCVSKEAQLKKYQSQQLL